jgi:hypothetical protein
MTGHIRGWTFLSVLLGLVAVSLDAQPIETDLLVVGGTESGWAAAIQAARMGVKSIVLVNDIEWLGGQFSAEAVCAIDENRGVEPQAPFARSGLFAEIAQRIEKFNLEKYGYRNPGNAWTARTTARPAEAAQLFREMIAPYVDRGQVRLVSNYYPFAADLDSDGRTLRSVHFRSTEEGQPDITVHARITIDASDWGDVIQASGAAFEYGPDPRYKYGEPNAPTDPAKYPLPEMDPITYALVIEETDKYEPIQKPRHFDDRRYYLTSDLTKQDYLALNWPYPPHRPFNPVWTPLEGIHYQGPRSVYSQRRLVDRYNHKLKGDYRDVILLLWTIQDYPLDILPQWVADELEKNEPGAARKNIVVMSREQRQIVFEDAKQHSLGMLYHLQTTADERMDDKTHSFRRFRLSREFGTPDKTPPKPYIRESLRLKALYMMREQDSRNFDNGIDVDTPYARAGSRNIKDAFAHAMYYDAVSVWQRSYDFHPTGRMFLDGNRAGPWASYIKPHRSWNTRNDRAVFPLRSLVPERINGLLGAQKNLGYSSIVCSAVRIHDESIAIGQAAGATAAIALRRNIQPRAIPVDLGVLSEVQKALCARLDGGVPSMLWPYRDLKPSDPWFEAANLLAVHQLLPFNRREVDFRAKDPAEPAWVSEIVARSKRRFRNCPGPPAAGGFSRGEFARRWWNMVKDLPQYPPSRASAIDSDNDGIRDRDDAAPFDRNNNNLMDHLE